MFFFVLFWNVLRRFKIFREGWMKNKTAFCVYVFRWFSFVFQIFACWAYCVIYSTPSQKFSMKCINGFVTPKYQHFSHFLFDRYTNVQIKFSYNYEIYIKLPHFKIKHWIHHMYEYYFNRNKSKNKIEFFPFDERYTLPQIINGNLFWSFCEFMFQKLGTVHTYVHTRLFWNRARFIRSYVVF